METLDIIILILGVVTVSFWSYCTIFYNHDRELPLYDSKRVLLYPSAYALFGIFQWLLLTSYLIWEFSWIGIAAFILIFVLGFYLSNLYHKVTNLQPNAALALFGTSFWILFTSIIIKVILLK